MEKRYLPAKPSAAYEPVKPKIGSYFGDGGKMPKIFIMM